MIESGALHHFSDASELGYGGVSYIRLVNELGDVRWSLVMAKSRLAPLEATTIPRLELSPAVLAIKLDNDLPGNHATHQKFDLLERQHLCTAVYKK